MDDEMAALEVMDYEIERRLDLYARARLSPDPQVKARTRARLMREARLQFDASRIAAQAAPAVIPSTHRSMLRRVAVPLLAASLWLGIAVGSISAAQAGGPLYPTRLWIEHAALPSVGPARMSAELDRLDARLGEAMLAASRGDDAAVQAALDAYRQIADEAVASAAGDEALEARIAAALDQHRAVLTAVAAQLDARANDAATAAVEAAIARAIVHNQEAIAHFGATNGNGGGSSGTGGSGGSGTSGGSTNGGGTGAGSGSSTGGADHPAGPPPSSEAGNGGAGNGSGSGGTDGGKPDKTPKPTPAPQPTPETKPVHTPHGNN